MKEGPRLPTQPRRSTACKSRAGGVSDRQWRDVLGVVRVQGEGLDRCYLRQNAPTLGVTEILERALLEA